MEQPLAHILQAIQEMNEKLTIIMEKQVVRDWYTVDQFAKEVELAPETIRGYCRDARLNAEKRRSGRGGKKEWIISHEERLRYQRHGLLPEKD